VIGCRRRGTGVRIDVWDTGVGIPVEQHGRIFEAFYRGPESDGGGSKGLGLGLTIVSRLSVLLGLSVEMASTVGRGSRFSVNVPVAEEGGSAMMMRKNPARQPLHWKALPCW
jgi:signal transduction histidine kinase